jgi:hypothetical protein
VCFWFGSDEFIIRADYRGSPVSHKGDARHRIPETVVVSLQKVMELHGLDNRVAQIAAYRLQIFV